MAFLSSSLVGIVLDWTIVHVGFDTVAVGALAVAYEKYRGVYREVESLADLLMGLRARGENEGAVMFQSVI